MLIPSWNISQLKCRTCKEHRRIEIKIHAWKVPEGNNPSLELHHSSADGLINLNYITTILNAEIITNL